MENALLLSETIEHSLLLSWDEAEALTGVERTVAFRSLMSVHEQCSFTQKHATVVMERLRCQFQSQEALLAMEVLVEMGVGLLPNQVPHLFSLSKQIREKLLDRNIDCQSRDSLGNTALHVLGYASQVDANMEENWKDLLVLGLDPRAKNANDDTPLSLARSNGFHEKAAFWVGEFEARKVALTLEGKTPSVGMKKSTPRL